MQLKKKKKVRHQKQKQNKKKTTTEVRLSDRKKRTTSSWYQTELEAKEKSLLAGIWKKVKIQQSKAAEGRRLDSRKQAGKHFRCIQTEREREREKEEEGKI